MGKIAFVFAGQGDQYPGMGKELCEQYACAKAVYDMCDSIRPGTSQQCFDGSAEELMETKNTQPCLFATELAAAAVLREKGIKPDAVAGFSLGEVVACTVSGIVDDETGFRLVCKRGELMQHAAEKHDTAMAAVLKLTAEQVEDVCRTQNEVYPVNFNCPGQTTVSGLATSMPDFFAAVKAAGGRAMPLKVKGAFHSPFMKQASEAFAAELAKVSFSSANTVMYSNITGKPYDGEVTDLLSRQICSPVRWENTVRDMLANGIDTFIEIGPGKTLSNMIKRIEPSAKIYCVSELDALLSEVAGC